MRVSACSRGSGGWRTRRDESGMPRRDFEGLSASVRGRPRREPSHSAEEAARGLAAQFIQLRGFVGPPNPPRRVEFLMVASCRVAVSKRTLEMGATTLERMPRAGSTTRSAAGSHAIVDPIGSSRTSIRCSTTAALLAAPPCTPGAHRGRAGPERVRETLTGAARDRGPQGGFYSALRL